MERWESWLSSKSKTGLSTLGLTCLMKWVIKMRKSDFVIHPEGFAVLQDPGGPKLMKWSLKFLGKMNIGGMELQM